MSTKKCICYFLISLLFLFHGFYSFSQDSSLEEAKKYEQENKITDAVSIYKRWLEQNTDYRDFIQVLRHVIQLDSNSIDILAFLYTIQPRCRTQEGKIFVAESIAHIEEFHGNLSNARKQYLYVYTNGTGKERFPSLLAAAQILYKQGIFGKSREAAGIILKHAEDNEILAKAGILVSSIHIAHGEWEKAKNNYISLIKQYKSTTIYPVILLGYLECLHFLGNEQEMNRVLEVFKKYFPSSPEYFLALKLTDPAGEGSISYYPSPSSFIFDNEPVEESATPVPPVETKDEPDVPAFIQTGSFVMPENAEDMVKELKKKNIKALIREKTINNKIYYRVLIELESSEPGIINDYVVRLKEAGFEGFLITE